MRLIDVDELIEYFDEDLEGYDNREYILHMLDSKGRSARVEAIPIDKPFLKMKYKGYTVYKTEWLKEHIEMEYRVIKGISASKTEAIPIEWVEKFLKDMPKHSSPYFYKRFLRNAIRDMVRQWRKENGS